MGYDPYLNNLLGVKSLCVLFDLLRGTTLVTDRFHLDSPYFEFRSFEQGGHSSEGKSKGQKEIIHQLLSLPWVSKAVFFFLSKGL